jgi:hypothetical protein
MAEELFGRCGVRRCAFKGMCKRCSDGKLDTELILA